MLHSTRFLLPLRSGASCVALAVAVLVSGCATPDAAPVLSAPVPAGFKEADGAVQWLPAAPADALDRGPWWSLFGDAELDRLAERVQVSNQNIAAAVAAQAQAEALVREQRAGLLPTLGLQAGADRSGGRGAVRRGTGFDAAVSADWAPDVWGRLRRAVDGATANAQASAADLASARLAAVGEMAANYLALRRADAEAALLAATVEGYQRSLQIARNRYDAGVAPQTDVLQAQTQLSNAQADIAGAVQERALREHAVAVLVGTPPAEFAIAPRTDWTPSVPGVPLALPSELLQRRPDIAGVERAVAAANAQAGIARTAYFPSIALGASLGNGGSRIGDLFSASTAVWSLGVSVAQVLFDGGAIAARIEGADAARDGAVARYRQAVLAAFQSVEDQLSTIAALGQQEELRRAAAASASRAEEQVGNRYRAGQVGYTEVVQAQATSLSARRAVLQVQSARQTAALQLIQALGGGWQAPWTPESGQR